MARPKSKVPKKLPKIKKEKKSKKKRLELKPKITEPIVPVIKVRRKYNKKPKPEVSSIPREAFKHVKDGYTYYVFEKKRGSEPEMITFTEYSDKVDNLVKNLSSTSNKSVFTVKKQKTRSDLVW